jgi:PAS domain S-box-containing protein
VNPPADARESVDSRPSDLELRVRDELLKLAYRDQPLSLGTALVYAFAVAWVLAGAVNSTAPWAWFGVIAAITIGRFVLTVIYRRAQPLPAAHGKWIAGFFVGAVAMGLAWGAMGWAFYPAVPNSYRALVVMVIGGIAAASSRSIAAQLSTYAVFCIVAVAPLVVRLWTSGSTGGAFMAAFLLIFVTFLVGAAGSFRNTVARSFRLGLQNADLAASLTDDISARRTAEAALRASEERLRFALHALDHAQDLVAVVDREGRALHVNAAFCRFSGRTEAELRAGAAWVCCAAVDGAGFAARWDAAKRNGGITFEGEIAAPGGEAKPVEVNASHVEFDGHEAVCVICRDLTGRHATEREKARLQQQLQETQKLESLGVLAGGIAHDFNNLLTAILGNAALARQSLDRPAEVREMLGQVERAGNQAAGLCRQMLAYAGKGRFLVEPLSLSPLVSDSTRLLEMTIARRARLELRLDPTLPAVMADASQMRQIVMNLVHNAAEAIHEIDGRILVATSPIKIDRPLVAAARVASDLPDGPGVCLEVRDNGSGMDAATLERIFEPFFTTKFTGRGLGLAAVLGIVRSHRGLLLVQSDVGRGTSFRLVLPATEMADNGVAAPAAIPTVVKNSGRVLIVDDEETVRNVARQLLERVGFTVETAEDGEAALVALQPDVDRFRLILLDMTMPRLDGIRTLQEMRRRGSRSQVLLMSGFSEQQARERLGACNVSGFLQKPFDFPVLQQRIEVALRTPVPRVTGPDVAG